MAKIFDKENAALMSFGKAMSRMAAMPLDESEIWYDLAELREYAKNGDTAYAGMKVAYVDQANGKVYQYSIQIDGSLAEIGDKVEADGITLVKSADGVLSLIAPTSPDASKTYNLTYANGAYSWEEVDTETAAGQSLAIQQLQGRATALETKVSGADGKSGLVAQVAGLVEAVGAPADGDTAASGVYAAIAEVEADLVEAIGAPADGDVAASGVYAAVAEVADDLTGVAGRVSSIESAVNNTTTGLGAHETRIQAMETFWSAADDSDGIVNKLKEIQKYIADDETGAATMAGHIQDNADAIALLNKTDGTVGSVKKTVDDAIAAQATIDDGKYATKAQLAATDAAVATKAEKSYVDTELGKKANAADLTNNYYQKDDVYTKEEIADLLSDITGDSEQSLEGIAGTLSSHITEATGKFASLDSKNGEQDTAIKANTDAIAEINKATTGIYDRAVAKAEEKVNALKTTYVDVNTGNISALDGKVTGIQGSITTINGQISALGQKDIELAGEIAGVKGVHDTLSGTVAGHTTSIKALEDKDIELAASILANTNKFADYSTTSQVDTKISTAITNNNTTVNAAIQANTKAIEDEAKARDDEDKRLAGLISDNADAILVNAGAIKALDETLKAALDNDDNKALDSIKELATWISEHDTEVLPVVNANKAAIDLLNDTTGKAGSVKKTVEDAIANQAVATTTTKGVVKASADIAVAEDGTMSISPNAFSTDRLVQGSLTLVLNGGTASSN